MGLACFFLIFILLHDCSVKFTIITKDAYTDKKENEIFLIHKEIQGGSGAKSYMRKGFLLYEEMRKYLTIYKEAVSHI
jgi:hypothetical protein